MDVLRTIFGSVRRVVVVSGHQFNEPEAWRLFRLAAFAEAIGWTLLITGIIITTYLAHGNRDAVIIAGQLHGMLFFAYIAAAAVFSVSLGWSPQKTLIALAASVPPYGTLFFEHWAARSRAIAEAHNYRRIEVRAIISNRGQLLAMQPRETTDWQLLGGQVQGKEAASQALRRLVYLQTGVALIPGDICQVTETVTAKKPTLVLYFAVQNNLDFKNVTALKPGPEVDELSYVEASNFQLPWLNAQGKNPPIFYRDK